jgi:hypothetical protein
LSRIAFNVSIFSITYVLRSYVQKYKSLFQENNTFIYHLEF